MHIPHPGDLPADNTLRQRYEAALKGPPVSLPQVADAAFWRFAVTALAFSLFSLLPTLLQG
jgi:hypothetical protein